MLAVRITRRGWEEALSHAVLTSPERNVYRDYEDWKEQFDRALVHVQWDPERSIRGAALPYRSIQVGISRHLIAKYVEESPGCRPGNAPTFLLQALKGRNSVAIPPFQGLADLLSADPGLQPGLCYLAPSGLKAKATGSRGIDR